MGGKIPGQERIALLEQRIKDLEAEVWQLRELKGKEASVAEKEERKEEKGQPT